MTGMTQSAPYPTVLADLVNGLTYRPDWGFSLSDLDRGQGSEGLTLSVYVTAPNGYDPTRTVNVVHYFIVPAAAVPAAAYDRRSWLRWLLDRLLEVERHEACEFFTVDGKKPYAPSHGPGNDPYLIREVGTDVDRRTSFRGDVKGDS